MYFLKNKFIFSALIILVIIFFHLILIISPLEKIIFVVLKPFQSATFSAHNNISLKLSELAVRKNIIEENKKLNKKINYLEQKIVELKLLIKENDLLANQNQYLKSIKHNFVNAKIIAVGVNSNPNLLIINQGTNSKIKTGMAVVAEKGTLVGKIVAAENNISYLLLLTDNQIKVSASLAGGLEILGVAQGENNISISLNYILKTSQVKKGDLVMTSGFDEQIPAGFLIGEVDKITVDHNKLFKTANLISPVDFKKLRIVSVVLD